MHTSFEPNWTGKTITKIETFRKNGVISDMYLCFSDGSAGAVGGIQSNPGYIACVTETPNDPSSPTAKIQVGNNEAPKEPFGAALWLGHIWKSGSNLKIEVIPNGETLTIPIKYILTIINSSEQYDENNEYYLSQ